MIVRGKELADKLQDAPDGAEGYLRDINGNKVGEWFLSELDD